MDEIIIRSTSRRVHPNYSLSPLRDKYILKDERTYAYLKVKINTIKNTKSVECKNGMPTGRVWAGFFHTRTRPAGQDPWPRPGPFRVPGFFLGPGPAPVGPYGPHLGIGPNSWPNQKKKNFKPRFIFAVQACIFQIKKLSPNLFLPTFKPAYSNSSLDNVTQMPNHRLLIINQ